MAYLCDDPGKGIECAVRIIAYGASAFGVAGATTAGYAGYRVGEMINENLDIASETVRTGIDVVGAGVCAVGGAYCGSLLIGVPATFGLMLAGGVVVEVGCDLVEKIRRSRAKGRLEKLISRKRDGDC